MIKKIFLFFIIWKVVALSLSYLAVFFLPNMAFFGSGKFGAGLPFFISVWGNFDGYHYMEIAQRGYQSLEQGFFPFFPILIRLSTIMFQIPLIISAQIISNLSFIASLFVMNKLLVYDKKGKLFNLMALIIIFFPTSFFYGAVYNDSLFLFFATLTIYLARRKNWFLSSLTGMFATLTRLNGLALFFFIIFEYVGSNNWKLKNFNFKEIIKNKIYFVFLIPLGFISYLFYINNIFNSWKMLFSSMNVWNQDKLTFPLIVFWRYFKIIVLYPTFHLNYWVALFELLMVVFYIGLLFYSYKKIRLSYWVLFALSILIPSLTGTFQGMPRYGLHLFPMYLSISLYLKYSRFFIKFLYFAVSIILLIFALTLFTRGYFVA